MWAFLAFKNKSKCIESVPHPPSMKVEQILGKKVARNKNPCNKNPTSSGWNYCSCLQLSVQFFRATRKLLTNLHSLNALLRKTILFFSYSSMLYFDSLKLFRLFIVDTRRRNIYFIRNKSSSFVIYIVESDYGVIPISNTYLINMAP